MQVPCGKCINCKIARSREWTLRCVHELSTTEGPSYFVTLTYADEHLPANGFLQRPHLTALFKDIRNEKLSFRYFACGEYGTNSLRPHYHVIFFGLCTPLSNTPTGPQLALIQEKWPYGQHHVGTVTPDSIRYTADYTLKAQNLANTPDNPVPPSFLAISKGIGKKWLEQNPDVVVENRLTFNGYKSGIPRYYAKKLDLDMAAMTEAYRTEHLQALALQAGSNLPSMTFLQEEKNGVQRGHTAASLQDLKGKSKL